MAGRANYHDTLMAATGERVSAALASDALDDLIVASAAMHAEYVVGFGLPARLEGAGRDAEPPYRAPFTASIPSVLRCGPDARYLAMQCT